MAGAALACAWISLPGLAFAPLATGIVLAWVWHCAQALQRSGSAMRALELKAEGAVRWQDGSGEWRDAEILSGSYVSGWLLVLILRGGGRRRSLVLLPDAAAADDLRRLRVWLRWRLGRG
jgi:hypothetical protein